MTPSTRATFEELRPRIEELLEAKDYTALELLLREQHPADIADFLELIGDEHLVAVFNQLDEEVAAEVLDEIGDEETRDLMEALSDEKIADLLETLPSDDAAALLSDLSDEQAEIVINLMEPEEAAEVKTLLAYEDGTAGRLMNTSIIRLRADWTVQKTLDHLREVPEEERGLSYLYVINGGGRLEGIVPLWKLMTARPETHLKDLLETQVVTVDVTTDQEEVARVVSQYDYFAIPVVDVERRLLGVVTHDDVLDILQDEFTEDVQRLGGAEPLEGSYLSTPVFTVTRKRVGWLLVLFATEMLTGSVMRIFESELEEAVALAFFIPLMIGTGGNSGSQATSTIIRALAVGEARFEDLARLVWHELRVGLLLGVVMGLVGLVRAMTWRVTFQLSLTVSLSLLAIVLWANIIGAILPPLAARLKIDPAVISGPVMSTLVDATGLMIYFSLARIIMGL
ncbi:MAG: magnesium transporter [Anaerolineae bacterium]|nr:magnesium transporter [Anaerolineae bacterium]